MSRATVRKMRCNYQHWDRCPNRATHWSPALRAHYCKHHANEGDKPIGKKR